MHASDEWTNTQAMIVSRRCDLCCRSTVFQRSRRHCQLHRFTDCHPEAIFDVNKRQDFSWGSLSSSSGRMFVWSPAIPLRTQFGSVRYFFTLLHATVWSNYQTLFNDLFEVYSTKMVTLSPNVQTVLLINSTLYSIDPSHAVNHSY